MLKINKEFKKTKESKDTEMHRKCGGGGGGVGVPNLAVTFAFWLEVLKKKSNTL